jgi:YbbR domain-containing protein
MVDRRWGEKFELALWVLLDALKQFFTENKLLKLLSLAMAILMWLSISTQDTRDRRLENIPLRVINNRSDTLVTSAPVKVVDLRIRGPLSLITDLEPDRIAVQIDVTDLGPGNHSVWLRADQVNTPPSVDVLRIDPPNVLVTVEALSNRQLRVKPIIKAGSIPANQVLVDAIVSPATVQARGPAALVGRLTGVETEPIDVQTTGSEGMLTVAVITPGQFVQLAPSTVEVYIRVDEIGEKRFINLIPTLTRGMLGGSTQAVNVTLRGPQMVLDKLGPADITIRLDTARLPKGVQEVSPSIELPEAYRGTIKVTSVEPQTIAVRLR